MKHSHSPLPPLTFVLTACTMLSPVLYGQIGSAALPPTNCATTPSGITSPSINQELNPACFPGSDMGQKIQTAYSVCETGGCTIKIPPGSYNVDTPVVIAKKGVSARIVGSGSSTRLTYTAKTGSMFQFASNGGANGAGWGSGVANMTLMNGQNAGATAITFGLPATDKTGRTAQGAYASDLLIVGFGKQLVYESQAWNITVDHSELIDFVTSAVWTNPAAVNMGESLNFVADTFANARNTWKANSVDIETGSVVGNCMGCNFDDAELTAHAGTFNLSNAYFENPGPTVRTTPWIDIQNAVMTLTGGTFADDTATESVTQPCISQNGGFTWTGGIMFGGGCHRAVIVQGRGGHTAVFGSISAIPNVPFIVHSNSVQPTGNDGYIVLRPDKPVIASQAIQFIGPDSAAHWLDLQNSTSGTTNDFFIEQDSNAKGNDWLLCAQSNAAFFCPIQGSPDGGHLGFHGLPDGAVNQHLYGSTQMDHIANGTGIQWVNASGCMFPAGTVGTTCPVTFSLSPAMPDDSYDAICQITGTPQNATGIGTITRKTTTSMQVSEVAMSTTSTGGGAMTCQLHHN
jgi:hypothetical protein